MGPFPHDAPRSTISDQNPAGTNGFEFVEFAHPEPQVLRDLFARMGYTHVANHRTKAVELWQQGDISYLINAEPGAMRRGSSRNMAPARRRWAGGSWMRTTPSPMRWRRGPRLTRVRGR
jgi:4-hydroxyphenylpyruvate dioxygenase